MDIPITQSQVEMEVLTSIVARVMDIQDITSGGEDQNYMMRYRGRLRKDSIDAYDQLANDLRSLNVTPLFRLEKGQHVILLLAGVHKAKASNPLVNLVMFGLTLLSMIFAGAFIVEPFNGVRGTENLFMAILAQLLRGLPFALSLLAILLAHEFGHYLAGRYHKTHVTLPYFIPFPLSPFGTMGAFIQLKEPPKNRRVLLDIGAAGPLAGLVVAIPVLLIGLALSPVGTIDVPPGQGVSMEGNSLLYLFMKYVMFGRLLPEPASYNGLPPLLYWARYFFTGQPFPIGGLDVQLHSVAFAGWAGLLVTALNLIPAGQLDGGHLLYVLFGRRARGLLPFILVGLVLLGLVWIGWWLWAFLIFMLGRLYAEPLDQITPLDPPRKAVAVLGLVLFILVFTPVPLMISIAGA